jgi:hypothetical protein
MLDGCGLRALFRSPKFKSSPCVPEFELEE